MSRAEAPPDERVQAVAKKVGANIRLARRRQRRGTASLARSAGISRSTLRRLESGDPGVTLATCARVLAELALLDGLERVAEGATDRLSLSIGDRFVPQRIHEARKRQRAPKGPPCPS